ncbi:c-type cytochrome [Tautonia plasticadhaerens]|uniref:Cytochrome c n=1 Tax=Tautonia plasticadhaerens TaxID=2527974 RepID=A0A518GZR6_9BACT|nr:c-type cytochrome [Tautonia plasticadhaerens]QDV34076.1 Cytochrome c [Tautonia plasticadhaerens]
MKIARRPHWIVGGFVLLGLASGCAEPEPVVFSHDERLSGEEFAEKPNARGAVETTVDAMFGASPDTIRAPEGSGLPPSGLEGIGGEGGDGSEGEGDAEIVPVADRPAEPGPLSAGQAVYTRHCLHCHGITGDGEGPTADFLYPRPRDYRQGMFKFTSTDYGKKPTRDDLRRVIRHGIDGTSMPAFGAQLTDEETERVIDYVAYLSMRGEVERALIEEASFFAEEDFADPEMREEFEFIAEDVTQGVIFPNWEDSQAPEAAMQPLSPRVEATEQSIARGRELFLGVASDVKLECAGCHGSGGKGDGPSWIDPETFNTYVFLENHDPGDPTTLETLKAIAEEQQRRWGDEWGDPLRPADLNRGVYKGGRRPIDLYWRIATGITGTAMPAHAPTLQDPDDLWHLVNFVLALPQRPDLLRPDQVRRLGATSPPAAAGAAAATASR